MHVFVTHPKTIYPVNEIPVSYECTVLSVVFFFFLLLAFVP